MYFPHVSALSGKCSFMSSINFNLKNIGGKRIYVRKM